MTTFTREAADSGPFDLGDEVSVSVAPKLTYIELEDDCGNSIALGPEAAVQLYFHLQKLTAHFRRDPL